MALENPARGEHSVQNARAHVCWRWHAPFQVAGVQAIHISDAHDCRHRPRSSPTECDARGGAYCVFPSERAPWSRFAWAWRAAV